VGRGGGKRASEKGWSRRGCVISGWQKGDAFRKQFPEEKEYRHSLPEEAESLTAAAKVVWQHRSIDNQQPERRPAVKGIRRRHDRASCFGQPGRSRHRPGLRHRPSPESRQGGKIPGEACGVEHGPRRSETRRRRPIKIASHVGATRFSFGVKDVHAASAELRFLKPGHSTSGRDHGFSPRKAVAGPRTLRSKASRNRRLPA